MLESLSMKSCGITEESGFTVSIMFPTSISPVYELVKRLKSSILIDLAATSVIYSTEGVIIDAAGVTSEIDDTAYEATFELTAEKKCF